MKPLILPLILSCLATSAYSQNADPADATKVNDTTPKSKTGMMADSPITFPETGALPRKYVPDVATTSLKLTEGYSFTSTPCRSLEQIDAIQEAMPSGKFNPVPTDWDALPRTKRALTEGREWHLLAVGDSIINDIMRSGWVAKLAQAYPKAEIKANVYVRGGGGCRHYKEENRVQKIIAPANPDLVFIGGISQRREIENIRDVIHQIRAVLPETEILLASGLFGGGDPRNEKAMALAQHSGTGEYGAELKALANEENCAYLDMTTPWMEFIKSSGVHPHLFYRDRVHANEYGEQIATKIMMSFFRE